MADYKGLNVRFRGDSTEASKALNIISADAKAAQGNLTSVQNALRSTATNGRELNDELRKFQIENLMRAMQDAAEKTQVYSQLLPQLKDRLIELQGSIEAKKLDIAAAMASDDGTEQARLNISSLQGQLNSLEEKERATAAEIDSTNQKMLVQGSQAKSLEASYQALSTAVAAGNTALGEAGADMREWGDNLKDAGDALSSMGDRMTLVSTIAIATFGRGMLSATEDFGNAMAQLGGYLEIGGSQLEHMSDLALKWGKDTQFSATEAAQAMNELAKGGMTQAQIEGGAMEATMSLAAAGELGMAQAAETAVQAIKVFGLEADEATSVADALAGAANKSTAEVSDLAQGFSQIGGAANMAGWDLNEVTGALALLADRGFSGSEAGTTLKTMLQRLASPTKKAADTMQGLGIEVYDASGKMVDAMDVVRQFETVMDGLTDEQRNKALLDIFGMRGVNGMTALLDTGTDKFQEYIDATERVGYATEMAQSRMGDLGWALEYLRGEAETATVNFGQALAPTIIKVAQAIEDGLQVWNDMSATERENIANMALFVTAAGPVISIVGHATSGLGEFVSMLGTGASTLANFREYMRQGGDASSNFAKALATATTPMADTAEGAAKVAEKTALIEQGMTNLAVGGAIAAASVAIGLFVEQVGSAIAHENELREATVGLESAMSGMEDAISGASDGVGDMFVRSADEISRASQQLLDDQRDLASSINETWSELGTNSGMLDRYVETIVELADKGNLTAGEQERLSTAVKGFCDITDASISVIDAQSGALDTNVAAILAAADAYKEYAKAAAVMKVYEETSEQLVRNQMEQQKYAEELKSGYQDLNVIQLAMAGALGDAADASVAAQRGMDEAKREASALEANLESLEKMLGDASMSSDEYSKTLQDLGISSRRAGEGLSSLADDADETAGAMDSAASATEDAADRMVTALKRAQEDAYTAQKRAYDDQYSDLKRALDDAYNARKDELSREADLQKSAMDAELKEWERAYKAEYDLRKSELDRQYKLLSDQLSKEADQLKKQNSAEDAALKKSLDARYKERQKALQKEAKEIQKQNQRLLKEAKAANKAETDAFKAETSKRIAAIKAEYEERKKALSGGDGTSDIDEQIRALKAETKAEQEEIKKRAQEKKRAELQSAVDHAGTKMSMREAEAALTEYVEELAQEEREARRDALIQQLEDRRDAIADETKDAKAQLDEERDAKIAAYQQERDDELAAIQERQEAAYEALSEKLAAELEQRQEHNASVLEAYRAQLDSELSALKEANAAKLERLKADNQAILEERKSSNEAMLKTMSDEHEREASARKAANEQALSDLKAAQNAQLESIKRSNEATLQAQKRANEDALTAMKRTQEDELTNLKASLKSGRDSIDAAGKEANSIVESTSKGISDKVRTLSGRMDEDERAIHTTMLRNANKAKSDVTGTVKAATDDMYGRFDWFQKQTDTLANMAGSNYDRGLGSQARSIKITAANIADDVTYEFSRPKASAYSDGYDAGYNFFDGLRNMAQSIWDQAAAIAQGVDDILGHSVPKKGPMHEGGRGEVAWGEDMVQNLIDGMANKESELQSMAERLAESMGAGFDFDRTYADMDVFFRRATELARSRMSSMSELMQGYAHAATGMGGQMASLPNVGVHAALRSGLPSSGVTVVMKGLTVREEADIDRIVHGVVREITTANRQSLRRESFAW